MTPDCGPAPIVTATRMGAEPTDTGCAFVDVGAAARLFATTPDAGVSRGVALPWARAELGVHTSGDAQARVVLQPTRSGGDQGYVGVAGESLVPIVLIAEARWDWRAAGLAVASGVVDDAWAMTVQPAWGYRPLLRPMVVEQGFVPRADTGGWLAWTAPEGLAEVVVSVTSGEGYQRRERNDGVDTTVVGRVHPLATLDTDVDLVVAGFAREGSYGLGQAPDHRGGGLVAVVHPWAAGGVDGLFGTGLGTPRCGRRGSRRGRGRATTAPSRRSSAQTAGRPRGGHPAPARPRCSRRRGRGSRPRRGRR